MSLTHGGHLSHRTAPEVRPGGSTLRALRHDPVVAVGATWAAVLVAIFATYARLPVDELYHVSREGVVGGLSRMLVEVNFPIALVAIAVVLHELDHLPAGWAWWGGASIALCAVVAMPGVVDDQDLDARWINVVPALGVAMAVVMAVKAVVAAPRSRAATPPLALDGARIGIGVFALLLAIPLIAALVGTYLPGTLFLTDRATGAAYAGEVAVHHGLHHGLDGALLLASGLVLSRPRLRRRGLAIAQRCYVSVMIAYGGVNLVQDTWNEQLTKRGWTDVWLRSAYHPALTAIWGVVIGLAVVVWFALAWEGRHADGGRRPS